MFRMFTDSSPTQIALSLGLLDVTRGKGKTMGQSINPVKPVWRRPETVDRDTCFLFSPS